MPPYTYEGMFIVQRAAGATDTDPYIGFDFNFEGGTTRPASLTWTTPRAVGIASGDLVTVTTGSPTNTTESEPLYAAESANSSQPTDVTTLACTYTAQSRSVEISLRLPARMENGRLTATAADGCAIDATLRARTQGNLYDVTATL